METGEYPPGPIGGDACAWCRESECLCNYSDLVSLTRPPSERLTGELPRRECCGSPFWKTPNIQIDGRSFTQTGANSMCGSVDNAGRPQTWMSAPSMGAITPKTLRVRAHRASPCRGQYRPPGSPRPRRRRCHRSRPHSSTDQSDRHWPQSLHRRPDWASLR